MKSLLLAGAALLSAATLPMMAMAQDMPASQTPGDAITPPPAADPAMSPAPPAGDPNAGQPTGAVPADTGMVPAPAGVPQDPDAPVGSSANPVTVGGNMTPPPAAAKDYPLCSRTVQDSCVNPREAGPRKRR